MAVENPVTGFAEPLPRLFWAVLVAVCLGVIYLILEIGLVRPYLWPGGHGLALAGDSVFAGSVNRTGILTRPPDVGGHELAVVLEVLPGSSAARQRLASGDEIITLRGGPNGELGISLTSIKTPLERIEAWRSAYWMGLRGPVTLEVARKDGRVESVRLDRLPAWASCDGCLGLWAKRHLGMLVQLVVFMAGALVLLLLRTASITAALAVMAFTLAAASGGGPLMGSEAILPPGLRQLMTVFAWAASPIAFPFVSLAILYFPSKSPLLTRRPWLHAVPFVVVAPMLAIGSLTGLYLAGVDSLAGAAVWDASHPTAYYALFALALAVNVCAMLEAIGRYLSNADANERRRVRLAMWTTVPGVFAFAVKEGLPLGALLATGRRVELPWPAVAFLQALVLLPAFGITYAVAVHRVFGPRVVLRNSLQYALARGTLGILTVLPAAALVLSLVHHQDMTLAMIIRGNSAFYLLTICFLLAMLKYRERARTWLDRRFFREEYDARKILLSLASRVPYETDPNELTAMVVDQIDRALHPEMVAILVSGIEDGQLTPVSVLHGSAESLPLDGGLLTMLRWSNEPLEIDLQDPKSPTRRLPASEQEWLECTAVSLLVPITTAGEGDRPLVGVMALGGKRSEEAYTSEDRELLASIAGQITLALDVARLRRRATDTETATGIITHPGDAASPLVVECPRCGRCEDAGTSLCPNDGALMTTVLPIPRVIDHKYRTDQVVGRGGMGAVYRARDLRLERDVAVKVVRAELVDDPGARTRFRREAQIVAKLQHPSVVSVFDYGTLPDGSAYLVMELVRGEDLRQALRREGRFTPEAAVRLIVPICAAIEAAHREGILHRDLKPENILLPQADVLVKVLDFGVAKIVARDETRDSATNVMPTLTVYGQPIGTPAYMAPEQLAGGEIDARTDVFSLGVITYEMLTGALPFGTGSIVDIAMRQTQGMPQMSSPGQAMPAPLEHVVRLALSTDPATRPSSPMAFASALQSAAAPA